MKRTYLLVPILLLISFFGINFYRNTINPAVLSVYDENTSLFEKFLPVFPKEIKENKFEEIVKRTESKKGTYGIFIKEIYGNQEYAYNQNELFYGASLYKIPISVATLKEVQEERISFEDNIQINENEFADGTGSLNKLYPGAKVGLGIILDKLLKESDNTAQNILWRIVPQSQIINSFNLITTKNYFYINNTVTPAQISNLLENLMTSDYLDANYKKVLLNKMSATFFDDRIHQGLSQEIVFSHKIGNWPETSSWHDCGIAQKEEKMIVVCVMSRNTTYQEFLAVTKDVGEFVNILF